MTRHLHLVTDTPSEADPDKPDVVFTVRPGCIRLCWIEDDGSYSTIDVTRSTLESVLKHNQPPLRELREQARGGT